MNTRRLFEQTKLDQKHQANIDKLNKLKVGDEEVHISTRSEFMNCGKYLYCRFNDHGCHGSYDLWKFQIVDATKNLDHWSITLRFLGGPVNEDGKLDEEILFKSKSKDESNASLLDKIRSCEIDQLSNLIDTNHDIFNNEWDLSDSFILQIQIIKSDSPNWNYHVVVLKDSSSNLEPKHDTPFNIYLKNIYFKNI